MPSIFRQFSFRFCKQFQTNFPPFQEFFLRVGIGHHKIQCRQTLKYYRIIFYLLKILILLNIIINSEKFLNKRKFGLLNIPKMKHIILWKLPILFSHGENGRFKIVINGWLFGMWRNLGNWMEGASSIPT
jgi:hypothetical protein